MTTWQESLRPLFERADREGLWFYSSYQAMWFSPDELRRKQAAGSFRWGAANWELRDPREHLAELRERAAGAARAALEFEQRLAAMG